MKPFKTLDPAGLQSRIARLKREERDLAERLGQQLAALQSADRWYKSDPLYQRLSSVLNGVRRDLQEAEEALRANGSAARAVVTPVENAHGRSLARLFRRSVARMACVAGPLGSVGEPALQG